MVLITYWIILKKADIHTFVTLAHFVTLSNLKRLSKAHLDFLINLVINLSESEGSFVLPSIERKFVFRFIYGLNNWNILEIYKNFNFSSSTEIIVSKILGFFSNTSFIFEMNIMYLYERCWEVYWEVLFRPTLILAVGSFI